VEIVKGVVNADDQVGATVIPVGPTIGAEVGKIQFVGKAETDCVE